MSKVYVIGATGGIGQQVTQNLLKRGVATTVYVRDPSKAGLIVWQTRSFEFGSRRL